MEASENSRREYEIFQKLEEAEREADITDMRYSSREVLSAKRQAIVSEEEKNIIDYIIVCISDFADRHGLQMNEAYAYLRQYKGIDFLLEFYDIEHTLSFEDAVDDLTTICRKNGGQIF